MPFSIGESISFGWQKTKENALLLLSIFGIWIGVIIALSLLKVFGLPDLVFQGLMNLLVNPLLTLGLMKVALDIAAEQKPQIADFFSCGPLLPTYWLIIFILIPLIVLIGAIFVGLAFAMGVTSVLQIKSLIVTNVFLILGLAVVCIVLWFIFLIRFVFLHWVLVDKKLGAIGCYRRSLEMTRGRSGEVFVALLAYAGLNIAGLLCCGIGLLLTAPTTFLALAHMYQVMDSTAPSASR